jgi:hypothetical protein
MKFFKPFRFKKGLASLGSSKGSKEFQNKRAEGGSIWTLIFIF